MGEIIAAISANIEMVHIVLFALGIIFMIAEMFEPGVGVLGGIGAVLMIIDVFVLAESIPQGLVLFAGVFLVILLFVIIMLVLASYGVLPKKLVLEDKSVTSESFAKAPPVKQGDTGTAVTLLRPTGKAVINGSCIDVISEGEFIEKDTEVIVVSVTGNRVTVTVK